MPKFYVTFGQKSPFKDGWVEIIAPNYKVARDEAFDIFGPKFAFIRETDSEEKMLEYFPAGRIGNVIDLSHVKDSHWYFCDDCEVKFKSEAAKCPNCGGINVTIDEPIIRLPKSKI